MRRPLIGVVDGDVVLEGIGAGDVVVVGVLRAPDEAAGLVFLAGDGLELHFHKPVLDVAVIPEADGIGGLAGLFEDVGFTGRVLSWTTDHFAAPVPVCVAVQPAGALPTCSLSKLIRDGLSDERGDIQGHEYAR